MALSDLPGVGTFQAAKPTIVAPLDLQPAIDKLMSAYEEGAISSQDLQKRAVEGTSGAEATRAKNEAAQAKAEQDVIDERGAPAPKKPKAPKSATPTLDRAVATQDFDPKHWSTEDLSKLAGEAGYKIAGAWFNKSNAPLNPAVGPILGAVF